MIVCYSAWTGGAVSLETKSTVIFTGSTTFENNVAASQGLELNLGGAVYAHVTESLILSGITAQHNTADIGGAIYISIAFNSLIENSRYKCVMTCRVIEMFVVEIVYPIGICMLSSTSVFFLIKPCMMVAH